MLIYGLDFTSAPTRRKPITCMCCQLQETELHVQEYRQFASFTVFENWLHSDGPWLAALDFPFGQPRMLIEALHWPMNWPDYVAHIENMGKEQFEATLRAYQASRPAGEKLLLRSSDRLAGACSPMMLYRIPVGKMFFQGAPRLLAAPVSILPCRLTNDDCIVIEGYPALVARALIGKRGYKSDERKQQTSEHRAARQAILEGLQSASCHSLYGVMPHIPEELAQQIIAEPMGDALDALLCALQAAWAYTQREHGYGVSDLCDALEGCIVDPQLYQLYQHTNNTNQRDAAPNVGVERGELVEEDHAK